MDVNGTRYHLLFGERDWREIIEQSAIDADHAEWQSAAAPRAIEFDAEFGGISLVRQVPLNAQSSDTRGIASIGAADADAFRNVFWIDTDARSLRVQPEGTRRSGEFWNVDAPAAEYIPRAGGFTPAAPPVPNYSETRLSGLAVTRHHFAVVGTQSPAGLLIFDLDSSGPPCPWRWPASLDFRPRLIASTPDGGVVIVDHNAETAATRLWRLDRQFTPVDLAARIELSAERTQDFSPLGGDPRVTPALTFGGPATLGPGAPVDVAAPLGVCVLPDDSVLLLDARLPGEAARLLRLVNGQLAASVTLDAALTSPQFGADLTNVAAFAHAVDSTSADEITGRCYIATSDFAQVFEFGFVARGDSFELKLHARALPLPGLEPPRLVATARDVRYLSAGRWFALAEQPRYRYLPWATLCDGQPPASSAMRFDGKQPGTVWHRVMFDACIPSGCEVRIRARAADEVDRLELEPWRDQPAPYLRGDGSELPFARPFGELRRGDPAHAHIGTFETLLAGANGQFLQLEITLVGDGRASPRIRAMRVYYPRFSYLYKYLPAVYREDRTAADFLDRWLANPEGMLTAIEGRIANSEIIFDAATAPPEYLDWLGGWFDALLDPSWDEGRRRLFLKFAWLLYRWRSSSLGLMAFLRLATDHCPDESVFEPLRTGTHADVATFGGYGIRLVENFELRQVPGLLLGDPTSAAPTLPTANTAWRPADGGAQLHEAFRRFLLERYLPSVQSATDADWTALLAAVNNAWQLESPLTELSSLNFSPVPPGNAAEQVDWREFGRIVFVSGYPSVSAGDAGAWREFLARRYGTIDAINAAYGRTGSAAWAGFGTIPLPAEHELPPDGAPLNDWLQFALRALPMRRNAHRFTVLVPAHPGEEPAARAQRLARVATIVEAEKPAHTSFDAKLFWALFQAGSARVGMDTIVGESSRFLPLVLDAGYLRDGYLPAAHPWTQTDRHVVGRDRFKRKGTWTSTTAAPAPLH
jgi:phage tail-like protein